MKKLVLAVIIVLASMGASGQNQFLTNGVAIKGYDPVAYFESNKAIEGNKAISTNFNEAIYYFSTEQNKTLFLKNPAQYVPQFGGFCAYGVSEGHLSPTEPEAFTLVDGKLYLNYNLKVKELWSKDREARIVRANENWVKGIAK
ncbi:YHS domain-containing (seleno)protein [Flavobacterium phycosphaerae]|uniref:YHS domain-containing (seleno)protein n=1 Tax=Flavobacterium phycosphaerae TaxID=2697515 RepID=UPI00138944E9|nr:YHS domain-containing (seleno)protein [Flavobacterium phycosphaerae]